MCDSFEKYSSLSTWLVRYWICSSIFTWEDWIVVSSNGTSVCCRVGSCLGKYDSNCMVIPTASATVVGCVCFTPTAIKGDFSWFK